MLPMMRSYNGTWMPSLFNEFLNNEFANPTITRATTPAINVTESDQNYKLDFAVPGITREMSNVSLSDEGNLVVKIETKKECEEKSEDGKRWLRREFNYGSYSQVFLLPDDVEREQISAQVNNGILTVELPKKTKDAVPASRQIEVK